MTSKVVFMGTPEFAVPSLKALFSNSMFEVAAVYTQPDKEAGRGRYISSSPVKELALSHNIKVHQPASLKEGNVIDHIKILQPDVIVVAAYGRIIPSEILCIPIHGCINVHPSLLPRYRGSSPTMEAILQGDSVTGVTIMLLDQGMDTGPLLTQRTIPVCDEDTNGTLGARLACTGADLLVETLPLWIAGKIQPQPQDESKASYTRIIAKEDGEINWHQAAVELWRRIRAFNPWPGCYTWWQEKRLRIIEALPIAAEYPAEAGRVLVITLGQESEIAVGTGQGVLSLNKIQLEGKRIVTAEEFVRGQRDFVGSKLR